MVKLNETYKNIFSGSAPVLHHENPVWHRTLYIHIKSRSRSVTLFQLSDWQKKTLKLRVGFSEVDVWDSAQSRLFIVAECWRTKAAGLGSETARLAAVVSE